MSTAMQNKNLQAFEYAANLGLLDNNWEGWALWKGQLFDPYSSATIGFRPEEVRGIPYKLMLLSELKKQIRDLQARELQSRQLTTLARQQQSQNHDRRSSLDRRVSWRAQAPISGRIAPDPVRGNPPGNRSIT